MTSPPDQPKIYHITHVKNLPSIVTDDAILCDRAMVQRGGPAREIGMSAIKRRRIEQLEVVSHRGTKVGDYVPFYFCPRSIMLYVIHCANHPELGYREGQGPIVHLVADIDEVLAWAERSERKWALSLSNAGARYTEFRSSRDALAELDWSAIAATDFREANVKEAKQAEFLVHESFPFSLVERIGVGSTAIQVRAASAFSASSHQPPIDVRPDWYF